MEERVVLKNKNDFYKLFSIMEKRITNTSIDLILEMNSLEPMEVLVIAQFAIVQITRKCKITIAGSTDVEAYIHAIGLIDFVGKNLAKPKTIEAIPSYSAMPIRKVTEETMNEYITATENYFETICTGKDAAMLDLCMSELINNVYNHSFSPIGAYIFCQFYPEKQEIKVAVSDYGIGIPRSINDYKLKKGLSPLPNLDCVKWAIKEHNTTHSIPRNTGRGLDNVNSFIRKNQGSWKLWTNEVLLNGYASGNCYDKNPIYGFKGTLVQLSINIKNLPEKEIVEFEW